MCGRFTLTRTDVGALARELAAEVDAASAGAYRPRWNVAPTDAHWVLRLVGGARRLVPARFGSGLPGSAGRLVINARSETAGALRAFREAFLGARCVVAADGFYEWRGPPGDRRPLWFRPPDRGLLLLAGLCLDGGPAPGFVILTTPANDLLRPVHDRMPALLTPAAAAAWLARPDAALLAPAPAGALVAQEVSPRVNDVANDGPELLHPPPPPRQLTLV